MAALIVIIMTLSMASLVIYSSLFMEKYYTKTKQDSIKEVYYKIKQVVKEDSTFSDDSSTKSVNKTCEKAGATSIVVDDSGNVVYDYGAGKMLEDRWRDIIFGRNIMQNKTPTLVEKGNGYKIHSTVDKESSDKYYELTSTLSNGYTIMIRMSVESFKESISISNKFYLGIGVVAILVATIIILIVTSRYTKPLLELADISKRMSNLDFDVKYKGHHNDELGVLGNSMNDMSDKLEKAITDLKSANIELQKDIEKKN